MEQHVPGLAEGGDLPNDDPAPGDTHQRPVLGDALVGSPTIGHGGDELVGLLGSGSLIAALVDRRSDQGADHSTGNGAPRRGGAGNLEG